MIFAIPILIAVALFLCWCFVKLTVHALPLFAAVTTALFLTHAGLGFGVVLICAGAVALAVLIGGRMMAAQVISPMVRLSILTAFAAPASVAAYHAVMGLTAPVVGSDAVRTLAASIIAIMVGGAAWRNVDSEGISHSRT